MRYILRMFRVGQTHPAALATWRGDDYDELLRIGRLNAQADYSLELTDTEKGVGEYVRERAASKRIP